MSPREEFPPDEPDPIRARHVAQEKSSTIFCLLPRELPRPHGDSSPFPRLRAPARLSRLRGLLRRTPTILRLHLPPNRLQMPGQSVHPRSATRRAPPRKRNQNKLDTPKSPALPILTTPHAKRLQNAMVAEASGKPKSPPKSKGGARIPTPLHTRLKVRNLYLGQALPHAEIAERVGLTAKQVGAIVCKDGLARIRKRRLEKITANADARTDATLEAFNEQLAQEAEEISLGALERARKEVESGGEFAAKDFQSWTGGIRNLVTAARTVRGLDRTKDSGDGSTVNVYLVRGETLESPMKRAEPIAVEAKALPA